jgi:Family of unknown function (DUF6158)
LDDKRLERDLRRLYETREETFLHGTRQALPNHTDRMLQLEHESANRFPERTRASERRARKGSRLRAARPAGGPARNVEAGLVSRRAPPDRLGWRLPRAGRPGTSERSTS